MIYLDNASTTMCTIEAAEAVKNNSVFNYFNPSAKYISALDVYRKLEEAREKLVSFVGANKKDYSVVFTGSATEANNMILSSGITSHYESLISIGEHSSVYETAKKLERDGKKVKFINLNNDGEVDLKDLEKNISAKTGFISVMLVSNETGAVNKVSEIIKLAKKINPKVKVHIDAVQGFGKIKINLDKLGADYLTVSSHKIGGPKGVGAVIYKKQIKLEPIIFGGGQEMGKRSGTENYPGIAGFITASESRIKTIEEHFKQVFEFKKEFSSALEENAKKHNLTLITNGNLESSSPYIYSVSFEGIKGEVILHSLEREGILVGTGSACNSAHSGNRILEAMGRTKKQVEGNVRFSFDYDTCKENPVTLAEKIIEIISKIKR